MAKKASQPKFIPPKPQAPHRRKGVATGKVGGYAADVDTTGMSQEDKDFFTGKRKKR
jgi:hypothetical protein